MEARRQCIFLFIFNWAS